MKILRPNTREVIIVPHLPNKKIPIIKLSLESIILLIIALGFLRFYGGFDPNTKYSPAKYEDGKLKPAENE